MKSKLFLHGRCGGSGCHGVPAEDVVGRPVAPWQPGMLDIHQISTGRGNAGFEQTWKPDDIVRQ